MSPADTGVGVAKCGTEGPGNSSLLAASLWSATAILMTDRIKLKDYLKTETNHEHISVRQLLNEKKKKFTPQFPPLEFTGYRIVRGHTLYTFFIPLKETSLLSSFNINLFNFLPITTGTCMRWEFICRKKILTNWAKLEDMEKGQKCKKKERKDVIIIRKMS